MYTMMMNAKAEIEKTKVELQTAYGELQKADWTAKFKDAYDSHQVYLEAVEIHKKAITKYAQLEETMKEMLASTKAELNTAREAMYAAYDDQVATFGGDAEIAAKEKYLERFAECTAASAKYLEISQARLKLHNEGNWISVADAYQMLKDAGTGLEAMLGAGLSDVRVAELKYAKAHEIYTAAYVHNDASMLAEEIKGLDPKTMVAEVEPGVDMRIVNQKVQEAEKAWKLEEMKTLEEKAEKAEKALELANKDYVLAVEHRQEAQTKWEGMALNWETAKDVPKGRLRWKKYLDDAEAAYQQAQRWENENLEIVKVKESEFEHALEALDITTRFRKAEEDFKKAHSHHADMSTHADACHTRFQSVRHMGLDTCEAESTREAFQAEWAAKLEEEDAEQLLNVLEQKYVAFFNK